ncbi:MAG TPA: prolipoprotein diacylglyceryl transferase family protein [Gemmatimonadaceae bacterium]|jgi:phosphatidylglycerol:prolipoprotein diacylglycerol transferase|nr:prolipoprotein diacylglyceryl transferase family protein [Gemmatimonadaceae bacterium]
MMSPIVHHPFTLQLGPLTLTGFGIAVVVAFAVAQHIAEHELTRRGHDSAPVADLILAAVVGGLLGAKLYYVVILGNYSSLFTRGGFVFWGGLVGGILAVMAVIRWKKIPMMRIFDVGGPAVAAAYAVGRTGCWAVGDDYGRPFSGFGAVMFPHGTPPSTVAAMMSDFHTKFPPGTDLSTVVSVYPTQLYEVALGTIMFLILWRLRDHKHAQGWLFGLYCVLAGLERFVIEFFRAKDDRFLGSLTYAQGIALAFVVMGLVWMRVRRDVAPGRPGIYAETPAAT